MGKGNKKAGKGRYSKNGADKVAAAEGAAAGKRVDKKVALGLFLGACLAVTCVVVLVLPHVSELQGAALYVGALAVFFAFGLVFANAAYPGFTSSAAGKLRLGAVAGFLLCAAALRVDDLLLADDKASTIAICVVWVLLLVPLALSFKGGKEKKAEGAERD